MTDLRHPWLERLLNAPVMDAWLAALGSEAGGGDAAAGFQPVGIVAQGSQGSSTAVLAGCLAWRSRRPVLLVVPHLDDADDALDDLELFPASGRSLPSERFGALEMLPGETGVSLELLAERLAIVSKLDAAARSSGGGGGGGGGAEAAALRPWVLVTPIQALMQSVPEPEALSQYSLTLQRGQDYSPATLVEWLATAGYQRVESIEQPGEFAVRGGIIDIFPPALTASGAAPEKRGDAGAGPGITATESAGTGTPIRLDYFGDEIESIRRVDPDTLGSQQTIERVQIIGASARQLQADERTTSLISLLPPDTVIVLHEVLELSEQARGYFERLTNPRGIYPPQAVFKALTARPHVEVNQYSATAKPKTAVPVPVRPLMTFDRDAGKAIAEVIELGEGGAADVVVLCPKEAERDRLLELIRDHTKPTTPSATGPSATASAAGTPAQSAVSSISPTNHAQPDTADSAGVPVALAVALGPVPLGAGPLTIEVGYIHRGFTWENPPTGTSKADSGGRRLHLVPHQELFHRYHMRRRIRRISASAGGAAGTKASDAFLELSAGDFVVHVDHGIALFTGLRTMKKDGLTQEYLTLEFADKVLLHVPASQIDLVQKYVGGFSGRPPLSTFGGKRWAKQKDQVAEAVKDLAAQMLRVQAARASMPGIRYPGDTPWQKEFEAEFPYEETEDQLAAISEVKRDMAHEQPMDRLICGDVGFGKTEVAIRAAFKAAEYGKQVVVLVPTTVLAEQHERTFRGRMADYPFRVESISRFKSAAQQRQTLKDLSEGRIDVIIGTHRLLSADVKFADLGLVVVDEEQRFGVEHKHKLLELRMTVDVLTLSATPIPRTLHMAMLGLRDISSLSTPPMDRRAIVTEVIAYDRDRVRDALVRELARDGQVYFVHNRVYNIQSIADDIQRLVPDARIAIGHGQMPGHELEDVMVKFVRHEADILVCTTIIESGLDIPTANTMFINQADHFGLADLHQLRGRVGRYKHRAYCYLLLPEDRPITDTAAHRLRAIEQYAMLGAGFKIAMRDLELRGAGNLLGAEQSGHIAAVGYELYCDLLEEATRRLKHETWVEPARTHLELPITGQIPKSYIGSDKYRMEAYRRLSRAAEPGEFDAVVKDLTDAYGPPPPAAQALIDLAEVRIAAGTLGIEMIKLEGPDLIFRTPTPAKLDAVFRDAPGRASVIDANSVYYRPPTKYLEPPTLLAVLRKLLVRPVRAQVNVAKGPTEPTRAEAGAVVGLEAPPPHATARPITENRARPPAPNLRPQHP